MTWFTEQRNRFIRLTLENTGRINTSHLADKFGITKIAAAQYLASYIDDRSDELFYDSTIRMWRLKVWPVSMTTEPLPCSV